MDTERREVVLHLVLCLTLLLAYGIALALYLAGVGPAAFGLACLIALASIAANLWMSLRLPSPFATSGERNGGEERSA